MAIGNYEHAARIGQDADAYANLGLLYYIDRRFTAALESYRAALDERPICHLVLWRDIGDVYSQLRLRADASASYDKAIALAAKRLAVNPRDASMLALLALCEAKSGRRAECRAARVGSAGAGPQRPRSAVHAGGDVCDLEPAGQSSGCTAIGAAKRLRAGARPQRRRPG